MAGNPFAAFRCRKLGATSGRVAGAAPNALQRPVASKAAAVPLASADQDPLAAQSLSCIGRPPAAAASKIRKPAAKRKAAGAPATDAAAEAAATEAAAAEAPKGVPERLGDGPLRLMLIGHNPSDHAWKSGHYYSNPSNWMWRLLRETGIAPPHIRGAQDDVLMPSDAGVGFVDVGCGVPGTASNQFSSEVVGGWGSGFYARLAAHVQRACVSIGCRCGQCGAPAVVAFTGKRQFAELVNHGKKGKAKAAISLGPQAIRPEGWPLPPSTEVWVLTSTSGAAPMTRAERKEPYQALADRIASVPQQRTATCVTAAACLVRENERADAHAEAEPEKAAVAVATANGSGPKQ